MYIVDGIAYASRMQEGMSVTSVKPVGNLCMMVEFSTGEKRLLDATPLTEFPAFEQLSPETVFESARLEDGIITWLDGKIDISTEKVYKMSYEYEAVT